jgi:uncharacterized protein (TIGR02145 family)
MKNTIKILNKNQLKHVCVIILFGSLVSCNSHKVTKPIVEIDSVTLITHSSARIYAQILDEGGTSPYNLGFAWSEKPGLTIDATNVETYYSTSYYLPITELKTGVTYYVAPYSFDQDRGRVLGKEVSFSTKTVETFTDPRDGNVYPVIALGKLLWMGENLRYETSMGSVAINSDSIDGIEKFGRLYTYETAKTACPAGWRLSTDDDWKDLEQHIATAMAEENKIFKHANSPASLIKHPGNKYFKNGSNEMTNSTGFTALPAGSYSELEGLRFLGVATYFWCHSEKEDTASMRMLTNINENIVQHLNKINHLNHFSVRCVTDQP